MVGQVRVTHQAGKCVPRKLVLISPKGPEHHSPVLVSGPLELGGVGVPGAHVLGLQMLHLGEDVEPAGAVSSRRRHLSV